MNKEKWINFLNDIPIEDSIKLAELNCPLCGGKLEQRYHVHFGEFNTKIIINCEKCRIEWTKKELFLYYSIVHYEE